mmetsp:Transcript_5187/g.11078  ORF Transcript_5187/g.11078 Transcript_5187/m.11078 type:complete len:224 (-) Transcript_5187:148-819(-)
MDADNKEREWELLGGDSDESAAKRWATGTLSPSQLVSSFWRASSDLEGSTTLSCEDVMERSEMVVSSPVAAAPPAEGDDSVSAKVAKDGGLSDSPKGDGSGGEYRLFEPLRTKVEAGSKEVRAFLSSAFGEYFANCCAANGPAAELYSKALNQRLALSFGLLNVVLSAVLLRSYLKNQTLKREMSKRGQYVERLINKLYEMQISYNSLHMNPQPLLEVTWRHL